MDKFHFWLKGQVLCFKQRNKKVAVKKDQLRKVVDRILLELHRPLES